MYTWRFSLLSYGRHPISRKHQGHQVQYITDITAAKVNVNYIDIIVIKAARIIGITDIMDSADFADITVMKTSGKSKTVLVSSVVSKYLRHHGNRNNEGQNRCLR
jgi:hypothetical protein